MEINLLAFGIAKDILGQRHLRLHVEDSATIKLLKHQLTTDYAGFTKLRTLRFAVNEQYVDDTHVLNPGDEVVMIPPVSGG